MKNNKKDESKKMGDRMVLKITWSKIRLITNKRTISVNTWRGEQNKLKSSLLITAGV